MEEKLSEALRSSIESYLETHYIDLQEVVYLDIPLIEKDLTVGSFVEDETIPMPQKCATRALSLEEMLCREDAGFTEVLLRHIDETGKKDAEIYKKAHLSKQHFSKIRSTLHYRPTKPTALALALALELSLEETQDLIGRAGYTLSYSSKFDLIVRYFIENEKYNITEVNIALFEFDQPLLGS